MDVARVLPYLHGRFYEIAARYCRYMRKSRRSPDQQLNVSRWSPISHYGTSIAGIRVAISEIPTIKPAHCRPCRAERLLFHSKETLCVTGKSNQRYLSSALAGPKRRVMRLTKPPRIAASSSCLSIGQGEIMSQLTCLPLVASASALHTSFIARITLCSLVFAAVGLSIGGPQGMSESQCVDLCSGEREFRGYRVHYRCEKCIAGVGAVEIDQAQSTKGSGHLKYVTNF